MEPPDPHRVPKGWLAVLLAGPCSLAAIVILLVAGRGWFDHGPGVPTAGRSEAWNLMWGCLALFAVGHAVSTIGLIAFAGLRWRRREPFPRAAWVSAGYHSLVALPALWLWFSWG